SDKLAEVGRRAAEARAAGQRTIMYSMGHRFPSEVADTAIGTEFESAVWNSGFSAFLVPEDSYQAGDVVIHIGYQHPPYRLLPKIAQAGAFLAYVDLYEHRDYRSNPNILWIDPMWDWTDAC